MEAIKGASQSKTVWFAAAVMVLGLLDQFTGVITSVVPEEYRGIVVAGIGLATAVLRFVTSKPLKDK